MNLSETIVSKKVLFTKKETEMKKAIMIITQVIIFIAAYFTMTPDTLEDNTHLFGLIGDIEVIKGNTDWVMLGAMVLSVINIIVWWPKVKVIHTTPIAENTKNEAKEIDQDPVVPKMD